MDRTFPRRTASFSAAIAAHAILLVGLVTLARVDNARVSVEEADGTHHALTWLADPGSGGGGGSGGNGHKDPIRRLTRIGDGADSLPSATPTPATSQPFVAQETTPPDPIQVSLKPIGDAIDSLPGHIGAAVADGISRGPGNGSGTGARDGSGDGDGNGSGVGSGRTRGCCDGVFSDGGDGVTRPTLLYMPRPRYTNEAMRARIQGTVTLECVVRLNGVCSDIRVVRSLDRTFGLDEEAIRAAALWRFKPGARFGEPVPVLVRIELAFSLR